MTSLAHFEKVAGVIELPGQAVIGGRLEPARFGRTFHNVTPRNGTVINGVTDCDAADVDLAVAAARRGLTIDAGGTCITTTRNKPCLRSPTSWSGTPRRSPCSSGSMMGTCDITTPFGGFKQSGFGRDRSLHALHKYADLKSVSITIR